MTWVALNNGLTGTALNVHYIIESPASRFLTSVGHELYIATDDGIYRMLSGGGRTWTKLTLPDPSNAEFGDSPAATVDELTFHWVAFDPTFSGTVLVLAGKASVERVWLYRSDQRGDIGTWTSRGVTTV